MILAITLAATLTTGYRTAHEADILREFTQFLAIPNIASDTPNIERNAAMLSEMLKRRGADVKLLRVEGAPPVVFGSLDTFGATKTITFYAHYDGQPTVASDWTNGQPWTPVMRDGHVWARSASDDKAAIVAMLTALDALRDAKRSPSVNLRFFFEGEEEAGSPHLARILANNAALLKTDTWILCDGPVHQTGRKLIFYGARGVSDVEITVFGPTRALHSGHYGNWVPNPIVVLTHLIDSMRDVDGRILVSNFYDDVVAPTEAELRAIAALPPVEDQLRAELGIAEPEAKNLNERLLLPALNLRGIASGSIGEKASNTIQKEATASIDFRLVPNQTPEKVRELIEAHVRAQGFFIVRETPAMATRLAHPKIARLTWHLGYPAARTPLDAPMSIAVADIIRTTFPDAVRLPTLGGSIPMYTFQQASHVPVIGVPIANYDNNQHAPNENIRLDYFWDGIELFAALFLGIR